MMVSPLPARSLLFAPGNKPALFSKAVASGADMVILDLEDAVGDAAKDDARSVVKAWLDTGSPVAIRINGVHTPWAEADLALCRHPHVAAVVIPKVEAADEVRRVRSALPASTLVLPMIESARSLQRAETIAREPGVHRLVFGTLDFQADLGVPDDNALDTFRSLLVLGSRLGGVQSPVDGITREFKTPEAVQRDTARSRALGFGGKLCIHPRQVEWVNTGFSPSSEEIAWAEQVVAADREASGGVTSVGDGMIDKPVMLRARRILASAARDARQ